MQNLFMIQVEQLSHTYASGTEALIDINFRIRQGEFVAIIGQNGAGKSTLVRHLNGLLRPTRGRVLIKGQDIRKSPVSHLARNIGFVFQNPDHQIFHEQVEKEIAFGPSNLGLSPQEVRLRVNEALKAVNLETYREASPQSLSKGQRQRLALASVLAMRTEVIVLDEPTTGLDYKESMQIMELAVRLNQEGHTIIFITHDMSLVARYAQRAIALCQGRVIVDDRVDAVFVQADKLRTTYVVPPQISLLAQEAGLKGILTPVGLYEALSNQAEVVDDVSCH